MPKRFYAVLAALFTAIGFSQSALSAVTAVCVPEKTLAQSIDDFISPATNAVSDFIFMSIPVRGGGELSKGSIGFNSDQIAEGDLLTVSMNGTSIVYEIDSDGAVCEGHQSLAKGTDGTETAANLASALEQDFGPLGLQSTHMGTHIALSLPSIAEASLTPVSAGIFVRDIDNGAIGFPFIVLWLLLGAVFFTFKMGFINLRGFAQSLRIVSGKYDNPTDPGEVTHFQALTAALSGTVGLGNIAGVAIAISIGGAGATFWMVLAGLFGMTSKFTECTLGLKYRTIDENGIVSGGPMYYLTRGLEKRGLGKLGKILAVMFALLCIGGAFGAGNMFQVNQSTQQFMNVMVPGIFGEGSFFEGKPWIVGSLYAVAVGLVIIGGIKSITKVTERLVPFMGILYVGAALVILITNAHHIPDAFSAIFEGAFSPTGVTGGFIGVMVQGLRRASFSNEAGVGSAAIAHSAAKTKEPVAEGMVALLEPFVDTVVICTMTSLVIIITDMHLTADVSDGIALTSKAFATVFTWFPYVLSIAVLLFAFSTSITWYYYGERCFVFLVGTSKKKAGTVFKLAFLATLIIGSSMQLNSVMGFADSMILAMAFPNMIGLYIMSGEVKKMLDDYLARVKSGQIAQTKPQRQKAPAE